MLLGGRKSSGFTRPSKDSTDVAKRGASRRGRGRGASSMKQTTLSFTQSRLLTLTIISFLDSKPTSVIEIEPFKPDFSLEKHKLYNLGQMQ